MALTPGTRIGPYEITSRLGEGGMGVVFRARDTKLGRDVAIKVVPDALAGDTDRLARFEREAQVLASLNHPNVAHIYGLEDSEGTRAIAMELVPGETLADRIRRGPLPIDEALGIAAQIVGALDAAHEKSIVHRDLKPGNVMVTPDGTVKVLDFGLAKALSAEAANVPGMSMSPTISVQATRAGVILGTAAYMAPEQARGKAVDRRADIWAFGCVLFEMLAGTPPFEVGETVSDAVAAILTREPDWTALPSATPRAIRTLLARCLVKDPQKRLPHIGVARLEIEEGLAAPVVASAVAPVPVAAIAPVASRRGRWLVTSLAVTAIGAAFALGMWWRPSPDTRARPLMQFTVPLLPDHGIVRAADMQPLAISSDGSRIAYVGTDGQTTRVYVRSLDTPEFKALPGTEGTTAVTFSPDGSSIAFHANGRLQRMPVVGGPATSIAEAFGTFGMFWGPDDTFAFNRGFTLGVVRVPVAGGPSELLITPDASKGESSALWPQLLPGGSELLVTIGPDSIASFDDAQIVVQGLGASGTRTKVFGGTGAQYLPTGHLLFAYRQTLFAAPYDVARRRLTSPAVPVVDNVMMTPGTGSVLAVVAANAGTLAYVPARPSPPDALVIYGTKGTMQTLHEIEGFGAAELTASPDGRRVAVRGVKANDDIHVFDVDTGAFSRVTFDGGDEQNPVWAPDGQHLAYSAARGQAAGIYLKTLDSNEAPTAILEGSAFRVPSSFSPDGSRLAFIEITDATREDIWTVALADQKALPFARTSFRERAPTFSPDGRWLAYESDESGAPQVYIAAYPSGGQKRQVSTEGGSEPVWDKTALFYRNGDAIMAVDVTASGGLLVSKPRHVLDGDFKSTTSTPGGRRFAPLPGGQRFVASKVGAQQPIGEVRLLLNWFDELSRVVPVAR